MSDDIDSILDAALDEFDAHAAATAAPAPAAAAAPTAMPAAAPSKPSEAPAATPAAATTSSASPSTALAATEADVASDPASLAAFQAFLQAMGGADGAAGGSGGPSEADLSAMLKQMAQLSASDLAGGDASSPSALAAASGATPAAAASASSADPISDAVRMIAEGARTLPPNAAAGAASAAGFDMSEPAMEAMLQKLMAEMGGAGGEGAAGGDTAGMESMVEQMMGSMLSREHLYQPMKDIAERYPGYLRDHAAELSESELANYRKQQGCFERIVLAFDAPGPTNSMAIMELMNEMQQYGAPPKEIVDNFQPPAGFDPTALPPGLAGLGGAGGMPPMDDALLQQLAKDDACKTQ